MDTRAARPQDSPLQKFKKCESSGQQERAAQSCEFQECLDRRQAHMELKAWDFGLIVPDECREVPVRTQLKSDEDVGELLLISWPAIRAACVSINMMTTSAPIAPRVGKLTVPLICKIKPLEIF